MSAKRLKGRESGFTLIEVTLAIVIGVIMIAGATLLYNQAKTSAGNSRAQAKVIAASQVVEEFAANNNGMYPQTAQLRTLWPRKRSDDWNLSPWGGLIGTATQVPTGDNATAVQNGIRLQGAEGTFDATIIAGTQTETVAVDPALAGVITYIRSTANASGSIVDLVTNSRKEFKGYAVWIHNTQGQFPNFVAGPKPN